MNSQLVSNSNAAPPVRLTRKEWLPLLLGILSWGLDGFDGSMFTLVLGPLIKDVTSSAGGAGQALGIAFGGGLAISLYLVGWAIGSITLGTLADYIGRVRMIVIGTALFAVFAALTAVADSYWHVAVFRLLAGIGSGVAFPVGATLVAESWNNKYRAKAISIMASSYAAGYFLSSVAYGYIGHLGWRTVMACTFLPAILVFVVAPFVQEPEIALEARRKRRSGVPQSSSQESIHKFTIAELFSKELRKTTILALVISIGSLVSFWSIVTWVPQIVRNLSAAGGLDAAMTTAHVATATALLNIGGFVGYLTWGSIADLIGRRKAFVISVSAMWFGSAALFPWNLPYEFYLFLLPIIGFGIFGSFTGCAVWFPEIFPSHLRSTGISFTNGSARILTAFGPLIAGVIAVEVFLGNLALALMVLASVGLISFISIALLPETKGSNLKAD